jgi:hypothetical protein
MEENTTSLFITRASLPARGLLEKLVQQIRSFGPFTVANGPAGSQGMPGEVANQQLSDAIAGTSANSNTVQPLDETADQAAIIAKLNELIQALRRM